MLELERRRRRSRGLNLTTLIDVMFIVLIFLMLTASFVKTESMELSMPSDSQTPPDYVKDSNAPIYLFIDNQSNIFAGRQPVAKNQLEASLKLALAQNPKRKIRVYCAPKVKVQKIVELVDTIYMAGGRAVAVNRWKK